MGRRRRRIRSIAFFRLKLLVATHNGLTAGDIINTTIRELEDEANEITDDIADLVVYSEGTVSYIDAWELTRDDRIAILRAIKRQHKRNAKANKNLM